ncbi:5-oxoprolinase subunit PxpB [Flavihumibacter stibioxidans]|uniref:Carboxyltransferase domain-containing protein n=1 Tax=Flavihumibacter stibioxidans TaxID=1834163 RepID=A0ABR7MD27_9BACT|nr:5-oxoprolinase subunit PxpB [Flavihumibacter stibioxidans]MBC6492866.1 hypothetical protein [Flavihumibacter stibioxidans]
MTIHRSPVFPLSESAITIEYGNEISVKRHRELMALMQAISQHTFPGFRDVSIAFNSLTVFFDPWEVYQHTQSSPLEFVTTWLQNLASIITSTSIVSGKEHLIPVCYDPSYGPDLATLAAYQGLDTEEVIRLHTSQVYYVFMVGFSPGFPYLGILPDALDTPRKASPALSVPAGSVGIAGKQTGIYPFNTPGGWNIIGRTPMKLFNIGDTNPCLLKAGDTVRFTRIDRQTFLYLNQYEDS